jgi:hypothetical protein
MAKLTGKAKANARKKAQAKAKARANSKNNIPNLTGGKDYAFKTGRVFTVQDEFNKLVKIVTDEIVPYNTKATPADFNAMGYEDGEGGFFIALLPRSGNGLVATDPNTNKVRKALDNFQLVNVNSHWMMASCFCSKDRALGHLEDIVDNVAYAFVGYSQPRHIAPLAENPKLCKALRDNTNPLERLSFA